MILRFLNMLWLFFKPVLFLLFLVLLVVSVLVSFWYFYYYFKEGRRLPKDTVTKRVKRTPLWKQLLVELPRRYVLDMFERPADYFGESGIHIFCGSQGSGKTMSAVEAMLRLQKQYPKSRCITNFGFASENTALVRWQQLLNYNNGFHGVIVGIDEIQNWFMSGHNKLPEGMLEIVTQNRKNRRVIYCTAQVFTRVSKAIREQVSRVYEPHTFFGCFTVVVMYVPAFDSEGNVIKRNYKGVYSFVHTQELREAYDTYKCIHMLSKEGFKDSASLTK